MIALTCSDFDYPLPTELIAQAPLDERAASRLLLLDGAKPGALEDRQTRELPALLSPLDLLVFNDTRVVPARVQTRKATGGKIELMFERALAGYTALVQLRGGKSLRAGMTLSSVGGVIRLLERREELWLVEFPEAPLAFLQRHGEVPLPPYIRRAALAQDRERYQSLLAQAPGAVAAPTASLHFDRPLLDALAARGIERCTLTLHVGAGTFQPLRHPELARHVIHAERYELPESASAAILRARERGGRVIAVGTTVARALESAALAANAAAPGDAVPAHSDETRLFIYPGFRFQAIDGLLTNFHLPQSSLLMLVSAYAGREAVLAAYAHAVRERYRFFSYGDLMLVWPARGVRA